MALKTHIVIVRPSWPPEAPYQVQWSEIDSWSKRPRSPRLTAPLQARTYEEAITEAARVLVLNPHQIG